jgi:hypothetical protein
MSGIILKKAYGGQPTNIRYENQATSSSFNVANVRITVGDILHSSLSEYDGAKNYIAYIEECSLWK